jgi:hypothetical protein
MEETRADEPVQGSAGRSHRLRLAAFLVTLAAAPLTAQDTLPPELGGYVHSLGLPSIYKPYASLGIGAGLRGDHALEAEAGVGLYRDLGNPVTELAGLSFEGYARAFNTRVDGGARALVLSHFFRVGAGIDLRMPGYEPAFMLAFVSPVRRGGIIGGGSDLRLQWIPARHSSLSLALTIPFHQPNRGHTRPLRYRVGLRAESPRPLPFLASDTLLVAQLAEMRRAALWVNRFTMPDLGGPLHDPASGMARQLAPLVAHAAELAATAQSASAAETEIRAYHRAVVLAFSRALDSGGAAVRTESTALGDWVSRAARRILLDRVLFPYNRLLGQFKNKDTTREFAEHARGAFARWLVLESLVPEDQVEAALYVFQQMLDVVEEVRGADRAVWGDSRLVWLPLQLGLLPEDYDDQEELDSLVSQAVGTRITHGNRIWYVHNQRFLLEVLRSIHLAQEYHILWVHDFPGFTPSGAPDRLSLLQATLAYLIALRDHVARYDETGRLPVYMIFLDQHYFEQNRSRTLLNLLQDPLGRRLRLPRAYDSLSSAIAEAQRVLKSAVDASVLLTAERSHYGEKWVHRLIKVQVSVTNPADPSFRSRQLLPLLGMPDDVMRDHSKAVLYDVSEADPYRGMAIYAGMGIGEHYAGPAWEDRALMLQGPAALRLRDEARALLELQGLGGGSVPHVLRPRPKAPDYDRLVRADIDSMDAWGGVASRAVALHNGTGFASKELSVAKATVFSLLSPRGVLVAPDALWLNRLFASLLTGSALRGARVLVITPSDRTAPARGLSLSLMHDLLARLLAARGVLGPEIARAGGMLRPGLYDPATSVDALASRVDALRQSLADNAFLRELFDLTPAASVVLDSARAILGPLPGDTGGTQPALAPRLHFKGFIYVSGEAWSRLVQGPAMAEGMRQYLLQRGRQLREGAAVTENEMADALQQSEAAIINPLLNLLPVGEQSRWAFFLQVGSPNNDYRSMAMDGEGAVLVSGWTSLYALPDFVLLTGLCSWPETGIDLDRRLPPVAGLRALLARIAAMAL